MQAVERLVCVGSASDFGPLETVESLLEVITLAHAAIYAEHRRLVDLGADDDESRRLLAESVRIVFSEAPDASRRARGLASEWGGRQLLDPSSAASALMATEEEAARAEPALRQLLRRQEEIAARLRSRLDEAFG
jgi:hypothetical protein